jgi:hypothetical protein
MTPACRVAGLAWAMAALPAGATDCGSALADAGRQQISGQGYTVAFVPSRWPIPVGQHFSLVLQVCADPGKALPAMVRVDADMPVHRHGMNYRATVRELAPGNYQADGLMFHMPGRWRFRLALGSGAQAVRLDRELDVQ